MLRLNRMTDYAIVVLAGLPVARASALAVGGTRTAQALAEATGVPLPTVAKILKSLVQGGIVTSQRGAAGGYALTRAPDAISVADVIEALDGPIAITSCVDGREGDCDVEQLCPMRGNWNRVNRAIRAALEAVSLTDMTMPDWRDAGPPARAARVARAAPAD